MTESIEKLETYANCSNFDSEEWENNKVIEFMLAVDQVLNGEK